MASNVTAALIVPAHLLAICALAQQKPAPAGMTPTDFQRKTFSFAAPNIAAAWSTDRSGARVTRLGAGHPDHAKPSNTAPSRSAAAQCQAFFSRPITDDLLPALHDAGCCDVLLTMRETLAVNDLERRLHCPAWHHYKAIYSTPAEDLEDLRSVDVPSIVADAVIPPISEGQPALPLPPSQPPVPSAQLVEQPQPAQTTPQQPSQPTSVPWTMMDAPAEFPEDVEWPEGYVPGPLDFGDDETAN